MFRKFGLTKSWVKSVIETTGKVLGEPVALDKGWKESEVPRNWLEEVEWWLGMQKLVSSVKGLQDQNQKLFDLAVILSKPSTNPKIR